MNQKAFTLIELLVTITILGLITFMGFPSLQKMLNSNKTTEFEYYGKTIVSAAKLYMQKEGRDLKENSTSFSKLKAGTYEISLKNLIDLGYLEAYKPSRKELSCNSDNSSAVKIKLDVNTNTITYQYKLTCEDASKKYTKTYTSDTFTITNK